MVISDRRNIFEPKICIVGHKKGNALGAYCKMLKNESGVYLVCAISSLIMLDAAMA